MNFIHIPKTAGQSVIKATGVEPNGHKRFVDLVDEVADGEFFTVVRNPYDRAVSTYYYLSQLHGGTPYNSGKNLNEFWAGVYGFSELIGDYMKPQMYFLSDEYGKLSDKITTILRYETLEKDCNCLAALNGFSPLEHLNSSKLRPSKHWREALNEESISIIGEIYAQDFEALGYEMITQKKNSECEAVSNINMIDSEMIERQNLISAKYRDKVAVKNDKVYPKPSGENLFIHIPKAAGSSIWATTGMKMEMHKELKFMTNRVKPDTFVFASIRNPYDRAVSLYYYLRTRIRKRTCRDWNAAMCCLAQGVDVNEFWLKFITPQQFKFQCKAFPMMRPQTDFLEDQESVISTRIDKILKVENLEEEWEELRAIRGFKPLAKRNVGRNRAKMPWVEELDPETIEHLSTLYDKDFKCLPYNKHNAH